MIDFYNAFISYKHAPLDSKVAEHVQRSLEHFVIPAKIKKKTGRKKIERIFRDKDELPITSDLTDTISNALEKAEYLIVICSPNTKQSMWVKREIQFFLKNHTKRQVLTVLAEGEPQDVIPEELLTEERTITNEIGMPYTVSVPIEPLSCDYRMPFKKAKKEELPRLASALIGCSYDELVRRQRAYRMRRMGIIFSLVIAAALAFGGYMMFSRMKINKLYLDSLVSQSRYLANESDKLMDNEQRIDALLLALASLPSDENDERPVTAEAVRAIHRASLAYQSLAGSNIESVWTYRMGSSVTDMMVSEEGTYLVAHDGFGSVCGWDTVTKQQVFSLNIQDIRGMHFINDETFVIWTSDKIFSYEAEDGSKNWTRTLDGQSFKNNQIMIPDDATILMPTHQNTIVKIGIADGKISGTIELGNDYNSEIITYSEFVLSPDKTKAVVTSYVGIDQYTFSVIDLASGRVNTARPTTDTIQDIGWADDNKIILAVDSDDEVSSFSVGANTILHKETLTVKCLNASSFSEIWSNDFESNAVTINSGFMRLPSQNNILYYRAEKVAIYDVNTGSIVHGGTLDSSVVDASDRDGDGWPLFITTGGGLLFPLSSGNGSFSYYDEFTDNLRRAVVNSGVYVNSAFSSDIIYYDTHVADDEWTNLDEDLVLESAGGSAYVDDRVFALVNQDDGGQPHILIVDPESTEIVANAEIGSSDDLFYSFKIVGRKDESLYVLYNSLDGVIIYDVDIEDGSVSKKELSDHCFSSNDPFDFDDGVISFLAYGGGRYYLVTYDTNKHKSKEYDLPIDRMNPYMAPSYIPEAGIIYVSTEDGEFIIDVDTEEISRVRYSGSWDGTVKAVGNSTGEIIAITDSNNIVLIDKEGIVDKTISCNGHIPLGYRFYKPDENSEILMVYYDDGLFNRYDVATGNFIGSSNFSYFIGYRGTADFEIDEEKRLLYVQLDGMLCMVDMDSWLELVNINNCFGHSPAADIFFTHSYIVSTEHSIGYYRHYTLQDLMDKADRLLMGEQMSDEMRSHYGL